MSRMTRVLLAERLEVLRQLAIAIPASEQRQQLLDELDAMNSTVIAKRHATASDLYDTWGPIAKKFKAAAQMLIGTLGGIAAIVVPLIIAIAGHQDIKVKSVLDIVALTLAAAAAIELSYTLFTEGPDEAIDPAALGLSSAIILQLASVDRFTMVEAGAAMLYALALGTLLYVRKKLVEAVER